MTVLDDLKYIHERDKSDALGIAEKQWQQLQYDFDVDLEAKGIQNIVFAGMGGSGLAALLSSSWPGYHVPFETLRNYTIPAYVSDKTLFIASSYSGNTEETLEALAQAEEKGARIAVIASGGSLANQAKEKNHPFAQLPGGLQPRMATLYSYKALLTFLAKAAMVESSTVASELNNCVELLKTATASWRPDVPTKDNHAKQIALELMGKSPVVYAGPLLYPAAYKWKISFNENAKNIAWSNQLPEFNHNEFLGWTEQPVQKPYAVIDLRSSLEHERVQKRFAVTERLLSGMRPAPIVVETRGDSLLQQLLWTVVLGDFVSLYLALLNGLDPTPVELIEKLKTALNE